MATVYWFGGTGNWSDQANHWSNNSGNTPASLHGSVPGTDDDVVFDTLSHTTDYTVTLDGTPNCQNFTMGAPLSGKVTLTGAASLSVYGNYNLSGGTSGITKTTSGLLSFKATSGTKTINSNGLTHRAITFDGSGGTFQLTSQLEIVTSSALTLTNGTFDANSQTVLFSGNQQQTINGAFTFYNLTKTGGAGTTGYLQLSTNVTVSNTLTITGDSAINRILVKSNTLGTARTITAAAISVSNADFQDITGAGAATWDLSAITGGSGNCGGNTMQALGDAAFTTADTWYWHADTGNVSDYTKWYTETNGGGTQMASTRVPLPQNILHFDASSFDSASQTVTQNMPRIGSINFTGSTNTPAFTTSTAASVFGSITLISGMTLTNSTQTYIFEGKDSDTTLDSGGKTWNKNIHIMKIGRTLTLKSDIIVSYTLTLFYGTLSAVDGANNWNVKCNNFSDSGIETRVLTMGTGTWELTGGGTSVLWGVGTTGITINKGSSTIKLTGTLTADRYFSGGNYTYYNIWNATTGAYAIIFDNTNMAFNDIKIDAGRIVKFTNSRTYTCNTFTALGTSGSHITISNTSSTIHATLTKAGGGVIKGCNYIDISEMTGSPANTWYIGPNSTDTGSTTTNFYLSNSPFSGPFPTYNVV